MDAMKASIVLATYCPNETRLEICEQSFAFLHLTGLPRDEYELIVVNNGGLHGALVGDIGADLVIACSRNIGQPAALNAGISAARGDYIFQVDDDLDYKFGWMDYGLEMLRLYPKAIMQLRTHLPGSVNTMTREGHFIISHHGGQFIAHRSVFRKVGAFNCELFHWAGLWERNAARHGYQFIAAKDPQTVHLGGAASLQDGVEKWQLLRAK